MYHLVNAVDFTTIINANMDYSFVIKHKDINIYILLCPSAFYLTEFIIKCIFTKRSDPIIGRILAGNLLSPGLVTHNNGGLRIPFLSLFESRLV